MSTDRLPPPERGARLLFAALGFLITLAGQFAWYLTPEGRASGVWLGAVLSLLGGLCLVAGQWLQPPKWVGRLRISSRWVLVVLAVVLALMTAALQVVFGNFGRTNYLPVVLLWLAGAAIYVWACVGELPSRSAVRAWLLEHRRDLLLLGGLVAVGGALRFYELGSVPRVIDGDEGRVGVAALETLANPLANPFALWANFGGIYLQAIALSLNTLGVTPFALRLVPAVAGTLAIVATYLLARALLGTRGAWLAAALLAISHAHLHFSRIVSVAYIIETLFIPLELYFFYTGLRERRAWRVALGGLILGIHLSVYVSAQVILALVVVYLVIAWWIARPLIRGAGGLVAAFWLGVFITGLPQAVYAVRNPAEFTARLNADGTFQSGWLANEMAATGQNALQIMAGRAAHAFLTLNHLPAVDFYGARIPLLDLITATLFVTGLAYSLWRTRDSRYLLLNGYFWSLLLAIAIFAIPPTADSYRMLVTLPASMILAAAGLEQGLALLPLSGPNEQTTRRVIVGALLTAVLLLNARAYYVDFAARCRYGGDRSTRFASYLGNYLKTVDPETRVILLSDDELQYGTHASVDFLSGGNPVINWMEPVDALSINANTLVLAGPPRQMELREWARTQPTGSLTHLTDCDQPMLLVYAASISP